MKPIIEIFTAGCPVCNPVVKLVKETAKDNWELIVYDLAKQHNEKSLTDKIRKYGINRIPSIVMDGKLLACCNNEITRQDLIKEGIGQK